MNQYIAVLGYDREYKPVIIDEEDRHFLKTGRWMALNVHNRWYVREEGGQGYLHRLIMQPQEGLEVDHINGNGLDNRRENLRCVTHQENILNTGMFSHNTSGYRGVTVSKNGQWRGQVKCHGITYTTTYTPDKRLAALARDALMRRLHPGKLVYLNFPDIKKHPAAIMLLKDTIDRAVQPERWEFLVRQLEDAA